MWHFQIHIKLCTSYAARASLSQPLHLIQFHSFSSLFFLNLLSLLLCLSVDYNKECEENGRLLSEQPKHYNEPTIDTSTNTDVHVIVQVVEINCTDSSQQDQYQPQFMNQQQQQQQQQQQLPEQLMKQQYQAQQYPTQPQTNQAYWSKPTDGPVQFPSPAPGPQKIPSQPEQFPPQKSTQPAAYPPQAPQSSQPQPVQFPPQPSAYPPQGSQNLPNHPLPQSPQMKQMFPSGPNQPVSCSPQPTSGIYPPQEKPQVCPPQRKAFVQASFPASRGAAGGCNSPPSLYMLPGAECNPLGMNQTPPQQNYNEPWTTGLFDCMDDLNSALITAFFPCVTFGQIAEIVDNGQTTCSNSGFFYGLIAFCIAMPCLISCGYRTKLRARYGLVEDPGPDLAVHCIFEWCALCQEYRELQNRGLDPAIGWQGNVRRRNMQQQQVAMMPPMNQQMMP